MNFTRTLLLSTVGHIGLVFVLVNHTAPKLKPLMTKPDLTHYVNVRLQLPALMPETTTAPTLVEESIQKALTKAPAPYKRPKLAKATPPSKKTTTPIVKASEPSPILSITVDKKAAPAPLVARTKPLEKDSGSNTVQPTELEARAQTLKGSAPKLTRTQRRVVKRAYWNRLTRFFKDSGYSYPKRAILAGQEGKVYIVIEIDPSGLIIDASISKSSGFPILDASALEAVLATKRVPPLPNRINQKNRKFRIPIEYRLPS